MIMSDPIMEDVKHKFMWDTIIDIFKKVRNNEVIFDKDGVFKYVVKHPETGKMSIMYFDCQNGVTKIKYYICNKVFNDLNTSRNCYLCKYTSQYKNHLGNCIFCLAKTKTPVHKNCLNGYFDLVNWFNFNQIPYLEEDIFNTIIHYCEKIRDVEYKEGVILRSQFDEMTKKINKFQIKPFDKVLVRNFDHKKWCATFFSHYEYVGNHVKYRYCCIDGMCYTQCIPYEGNEYLVGTTYVPK